jgi:hypothetical protein
MPRRPLKLNPRDRQPNKTGLPKAPSGRENRLGNNQLKRNPTRTQAVATGPSDVGTSDRKVEIALTTNGDAAERKAAGRIGDIGQNVTSIGTEAGVSRTGATVSGTRNDDLLMIGGTAAGPNADTKVRGICRFPDASEPAFMIS